MDFGNMWLVSDLQMMIDHLMVCVFFGSNDSAACILECTISRKFWCILFDEFNNWLIEFNTL